MGEDVEESEPDLFRIVYDSVVLLPFGAEGAAALQTIVVRARSRNALSRITGVLRFDGAYFLQVLEGPRGPVVDTMARIRRDTRHTDVRILEASPVLHRDFANWTMALVTDEHVDQARLRNPGLLEVFPYRAAEVVHSLRSMLEGHGGVDQLEPPPR